MPLIFLLFSLNSIIEIDYTKANKNQQKFDAVPRNYLIWGKVQSAGPIYYADSSLSGRG